MTVLIMVGVFFLFVFTGVPIMVAITFAAVVFLFAVHQGYPINALFLTFIESLENLPLLAVPLFILAGTLISRGGTGKRIMEFSSSMLSYFTGGLGLVTVVSSMIFAGMSGSAVADSAAIASVMTPEMVRKKYSKGYTAALIGAAGTIGIIIPPSIPMIIYAFTANASTGKLFIAGIIPGILFGIGLIIINYITAKRNRADLKVTGQKISGRKLLVDFVKAVPALLIPVIILGGIFGGIFTPTEAGAVAVVYSWLVSQFLYRDFTWNEIPSIVSDSMMTSSSVLVVIAAASVLTWMITAQNVPQTLVQLLTGLTHSRWIFLLIINAFLLFLGMFIDPTSAIILSVPLLMPAAAAYHISPVQFGIVMISNLAIGLYTPPVGINLFVTSKIANIPIGRTMKSLVPILLMSIGILMLITYIPNISMLLVHLIH